MKLEITFTTLTDLKKQMGDLLEDMEVTHIQSGFQLPPEVRADIIADEQYAEQLKEEESLIEKMINEEEETEPLINELPAINPVDPEYKIELPIKKPKSSRKSKVEPEVVITPVVTEIANVSEVASVPTETPKNFYSESEFIRNFAQIVNHLISSKSIDQKYVQDKCMKYGITFIYALSADKTKLIQFYSELVNEGIVTKKGDY